MTTTSQPAPLAAPPPVGRVPSRGAQAGPPPVGRVPSRGAQAGPPPPRPDLDSHREKDRSDHTRHLLGAIRNMERDFGPDTFAPIYMEDISFLAISLRRSQAAHEECRRSRLSILQAFLHIPPA